MRRLSKLLYAGYPYNGERLYKIVDNSELHTPTESQFNEMLIPTPVLQTSVSVFRSPFFTYKDWETNDTEHLDELRRFMNAVAKTLSGWTNIEWSNILMILQRCRFIKQIFLYVI